MEQVDKRLTCRSRPDKDLRHESSQIKTICLRFQTNRVERCKVIRSDHGVVSEELDEGRSEVQEGGPVPGQGREEHPGLEPGEGDELSAVP